MSITFGIKSRLNVFLKKWKTKDYLEQLFILYSLNYEIKEVNVLLKTNYTSWQETFNHVYPNHHDNYLEDVVAAQMHHKQKTLTNKMISDVLKHKVYPLILIFISYLMIMVFNKTMMPQMMDIITDFGLEDHSLTRISILLHVLFFITNCSILFCISSIIFYKKLRVWIWIFGMKYVSLFRHEITNLYIEILMDHKVTGLSWNQCIDFMTSCQQFWYLKWLSSLIDAKLNEGLMLHQALSDSILDESLKRILLRCDVGESLESSLLHYMSLAKQSLIIRRKRFETLFKCSAYAYVGVVIVAYYTAIMIPIRLMEVL